jgi:aquaporin Z
MRRYLTEFIGTFFLGLSMGLSVLNGTPLAGLAIGVTLMVMVYMGGHISGGHYNPAVSIALTLRGALSAADLVPYMISQIAGSIVASLVVKMIMGQTFAPAPGPDATAMGALLVEILYTFALALVVLNVATSKKTQNNSYYGLAIGFTVVAAAFAGGPISGGAFNPAVGIGPTLVHAMAGGGNFSHLWLYLVGPVVGGVLAAMIFKVQEVDA